MTVEDLYGIWNVVEFFPLDACEAERLFYTPGSHRYWEPAYNAINDLYIEQNVVKGQVPPEDVLALQYFHEKYKETYGLECEPIEPEAITSAAEE